MLQGKKNGSNIASLTSEELNSYLCLFFPVILFKRMELSAAGINDIPALLGSEVRSIYLEYDEAHFAGDLVLEYIKEQAGEACKQIYMNMLTKQNDLQSTLQRLLTRSGKVDVSQATQIVRQLGIQNQTSQLFAEAMKELLKNDSVDVVFSDDE